MIKLDDYSIFRDNRTTLKETSKDNHDGNEMFMTMLTIPAINFDRVKDEYIVNLHLPEPPKSNDALCSMPDGTLIFIEFKSGCMSSKIYEVRGKIYDSLLMVSDIIGEGISYTRKNMDYILVYSAEKNPIEGQDICDPADKIQESESRLQIAKILTKLGKKDYIRFGLERFKSYCFRNVFTYTIEEFEEKITNLYQVS